MSKHYRHLCIGISFLVMIPTQLYAIFAPPPPAPGWDHIVWQNNNQQAVGAVLNDIKLAPSVDMDTILTEIGTLSDAQIQEVFNQISGQTQTSLSQVNHQVIGTFHKSMSNRICSLRNVSANGLFANSNIRIQASNITGDSAKDIAVIRDSQIDQNDSIYHTPQKWGVWGTLSATLGDRESENSTPGYSFTVQASSLGIDYQLTPELLVGFTAGYADSKVEYSPGSDRSDIYNSMIGIYSSYDVGSWYIDSMLSFADSKYRTRRHLTVGGIRRTAKGDFDGTDLSCYFETGLRYSCNGILVEPLMAYEFGYLRQDGYTETGAGSLNLDVDSNSSTLHNGSLGVRLSKELFRDPDWIISGQLRGRWLHSFADTSQSSSVRFASETGGFFSIEDNELNRDIAIIGLGITANLKRNTNLYFDIDNKLSSDNNVYMLAFGIEHRW